MSKFQPFIEPRYLFLSCNFSDLDHSLTIPVTDLRMMEEEAPKSLLAITSD